MTAPLRVEVLDPDGVPVSEFRDAAVAVEDEAAESFTAMVIGTGTMFPAPTVAGPWGWSHYVGVVVTADGDVIHTSGRVESREDAWKSIDAFLLDWRLAGYPPRDVQYSARV